jgi:peptide chain release factor 1
MTETYLLNKLSSVEQTFNELTRRLSDPDIATDPSEMQRVAKARSSLEEVVNTYETWKTAQEELAGVRQVLKESASDPELQEMAALEVQNLEAQLDQLEMTLKVLLYPAIRMMTKTIMLEFERDWRR